MFRLNGKTAIVTGGNGGIGLGIAGGLAAAGAAVAIVGRDVEKSNAALAELRANGAEAEAFGADLRDDAAIAAMVDAVAARFGGVDILVANAGTNTRMRPEAYPREVWDTIVDTNLGAVFRSCQAVHPRMRARGGGKIITIGSMTSIFGFSVGAAYSASKGAVVQLTKSLAIAWAPDGIQVNCILPGFIDTVLTKQARRDVPALEQRVVDRTPAARWGSRPTSRAPPSSSPRRRATSSPARRSRWTAGTRASWRRSTGHGAFGRTTVRLRAHRLSLFPLAVLGLRDGRRARGRRPPSRRRRRPGGLPRRGRDGAADVRRRPPRSRSSTRPMRDPRLVARLRTAPGRAVLSLPIAAQPEVRVSPAARGRGIRTSARGRARTGCPSPAA